MLNSDKRNKIIGYLNTINDSLTPQPTLSVLKALEFFGLPPKRPDNIFSYIKSLQDNQTGGFIDPATGNTAVLSTAVALLLLNQIRSMEFLNECLPSALNFMNLNAETREEHFMLIGVIDECKISSFYPDLSIRFFRAMEEDDGSFGESVLNNAIASSALLRIGENLKNPETIKSIMLSAQQQDGSFSDLWTSYCAMRTLDLLKTTLDNKKLQDWILGLLDKEPSVNETYQCLSILNWISSPVINAAKTGDINELKKWLNKGGSPDVSNLEGWTPLLAASVRRQSETVEFLLSNSIPGGKPANPKLRLESADASPVFWAGQSGDIKTAKALLKYDPEQLFDISKVNGHNLLLQAAFYGSENHLNMVRWILEDIGEILDIPENEIEATRLKLTTATNVRGYNGFTMSKLWGNKPMEELFSIYDKSTEADREAYLDELLKSIAPPESSDEKEKLKQQLSDQFVELIPKAFSKLQKIISEDFSELNGISADQFEKIKEVQKKLFDDYESLLLDIFKSLLSNPDFDINRLGGALSGTPVIVAVTGVDSVAEIANFRLELAKLLLENGADSNIPEKHPMAVDAVIRAAVLNNFDILKLISEYMEPLAFAAALNEKPAINGQTALQDTVHRALTAPQEQLTSHLEQLKWCISRGAQYDIEDHTGTSPEKLAIQALNDSVYRERATVVIDALGISNTEELKKNGIKKEKNRCAC